MISTAVWASRIQAALGREPQNVREALEGLRAVLKEEGGVKEEFYKAAREGWRFERFSREDRVALTVWAAMKEALEKTSKSLGQKKSSSLVVRKDERVKEEGGVKPIGTWKGPDRVYPVYPWDVRPTVRKGELVKHPQYGQGTILAVKGNVVTVRFKAGIKKLAERAVKGMLVDQYASAPDKRVNDSRRWLETFLASGEEVRAVSRLEREEELAGNPHFAEGIISQEVMNRLENVGYRVDPNDLEGLVSLVDALPAKEKKFVEGVLGASLLRTRDGKALARRQEEGWETKCAPDGQESFALLQEAVYAHAKLLELLEQEEGWLVREVLPHLSKLAKALEPTDARRLFDLVKEIGVLRLLKAELHRAGFAPVRAVAYRDPVSGEVLYTAPVYG
jgi:hypothetical protein